MFSMVLDLRSLPSLVFLKLDRKRKTVEKFCFHVTSINRFKEAERVKNFTTFRLRERKVPVMPHLSNHFFSSLFAIQYSCLAVETYPTTPTYQNAKIAPKLTASLRQCVESSSSILNHSKHTYLRSYIYHFQPIWGPNKCIFFPFWKPSCSLARPLGTTCCSMQRWSTRSLCHDWVCDGRVQCVRTCRPATHGKLRALARYALCSGRGDIVCVWLPIHFRPCGRVACIVAQKCMQLDKHCIW